MKIRRSPILQLISPNTQRRTPAAANELSNIAIALRRAPRAGKSSATEIHCPLGSDKSSILQSKEGLFQLQHEFNAVWAFAREGPAQGRVPFLDEEGEALLVGSGANALTAFKCCIENNRWAEFLDWRVCRAAVRPKMGRAPHPLSIMI